MTRPVRLAVRAILLKDDRLCLVNAWPTGVSDMLCAPGGGAENGQSLPDNLIREVHEETGMRITVGKPVLVNEFHDPDGDYHQCDIYFRCDIVDGPPPGIWTDPEGVVTEIHWIAREDMPRTKVKPDSLADVAWGDDPGIFYDVLEPIVR